MRFLRFSYILPRLVVVMLVLLATEVGSGYFLRWGFIAGGQSVVGARVEIDKVNASLLATRLSVQDLAVADPSAPMKNLLEADRLELDFSSHALLRKKLFAEYGVISGLEFSTPRESSGALPGEPPAESPDRQRPRWISSTADRYASQWLADFEQRLTSDLSQQFQSVRLAEQLRERWPQRYRDLQAKAEQLKQQAKALEQDVRAARQNPLRNTEFLAKLPGRATELRQSLRELQTALEELPAEIKADRAAVLAARQHDEQMIREHLQLDSLDRQALANYLLGEHITEPLAATVRWVRWARGWIPPRSIDAAEPATRGENVMFAGTRPMPDLLVKTIRVQGLARVSGQPVELSGVLRDWTTQPELHRRPTTLQLTAGDGLPLNLQATFDRTQVVPRDEVRCTTRDLLVPKAKLGKPGGLQLAMAPTRATVALRLELVGDVLDGRVDITQHGIQIEPSLAGGPIGQRMQAALEQSLSGIQQAETEVRLSGTLNDPQFDFDSSLGTALATAIHRAASDVVAAERERLMAVAQQEVDTQLAKLDAEIAKFDAAIAEELQGPGQIIASLLGSEGDPQLGKSPFGQFFK